MISFISAGSGVDVKVILLTSQPHPSYQYPT